MDATGTLRAILHICLPIPLFGLLILAFCAGPASAQSAFTAEEKLERDFTDPLMTLPQIIVRDSYPPATYGTHVLTNAVVVRPIIPRIPPYSLLPFVQLIRPTLSVVKVPSARGGNRTEFGDLAVFDIAVLPWPDRKRTGLLLGVGPTMIFPTANSKNARQGA
jgi:hypothetical protein